MDDHRRAELERIMAALAGGDRAMVIALHEAFGGEIEGALRVLDRCHELRVFRGLDRSALDGMVMDACFELERVARSWRPDGGALPWTWAAGRLLPVLLRHARVGSRLPPGADDGPEPEATACLVDVDSRAVLDALAARSPDVALIRSALQRAVRPADLHLFLVHAEQVAGGDPSPALTVGRLVGRSPAAVRKAVERSRRRLADLAAAEDEFRPLLRLPLLGPAAQRALGPAAPRAAAAEAA
jgi:hypothetical protein